MTTCLAVASESHQTIIVIIAIIGAVAMGIVALLCLCLMGRHHDNSKLKQSMVERGMSAQEIEQVLMLKTK